MFVVVVVVGTRYSHVRSICKHAVFIRARGAHRRVVLIGRAWASWAHAEQGGHLTPGSAVLHGNAAVKSEDQR